MNGSLSPAMAGSGSSGTYSNPARQAGWKAPADLSACEHAQAGGGAPSAYKVMRRERPAGAWQDVATAVITEATLVEQPKGKELEYRIIAVNKAGEGSPSNTAMVVL